MTQKKNFKPVAGQPPIRPINFTDVLGAAKWILDKAAEGQHGPDLSRNPNSKLSVIRRMMEEIVRSRRQLQDDATIIHSLEKLIEKLITKETPCTHPIAASSVAPTPPSLTVPNQPAPVAEASLPLSPPPA